ncbi:Kinesin-like protein KCA2 [Zea mays]|uniref:Kinesin-like protein KCA2 n=1 Tax=Zea mays TaxID=4577 RepID=A0A1D6NS25_MAIZE|nr:Kinesin-like protein KCA2 [Zea mays]
MADSRRTWSWDVSGFEPPQPATTQAASAPTAMPRAPPTAMMPRPSAGAPRASAGAVPVADQLDQLVDSVQLAREDCLELRQEASDLLEYSNAKLGRVTRYLGFLADRTRKLDQAALETEARITPLIHEKKRLFNDLLTLKGNVKVFCRCRPLFEDEGPSVLEFPDDFSIRVNTGDESLTNPKKDYEFDRVYGPHIGQGELFLDVQPFVQSALDGYNISIFAYGQSRSGKTHTLEGSSHDRGLYLRSFEELFDLSNSDTTSTAHFNFYFTACELYNDQVRDLLSESSSTVPKVRMGVQESFVELVQEKVENPLEFSAALKIALQNRSVNSPKAMVSHLIITIHIHYRNYVTGEHLYSKLSLVDLPASECLLEEDANRDNVTDFLHVSKSLSVLGDAFASLSAKKEPVLYGNSRITQILADSLGSSSKILLIVHVSPSASNLSRTLSTLSFSARARNAELSLGNRDTIKKWKDVANDSRKQLHDKEKEVLDLRQEVIGLKHSLKEANDQCILLFNEVQKAWRVSSSLQADLKSENLMLAEKHKTEKEQNNQLRDQISHLLKVEQEQNLKMQERDLTIQSLQTKLKSIESQLNEALNASDARSTIGSESASVISSPKITESTADSSSVTKRLEEELAKRDALIEETWRQHVTGGKLREITEEAKAFSIGNKALAALFVHTPAGELQRQIRAWLAENFEFLSVTGADAAGGAAGQLELLSTAIMDGWMAGLGTAQPPTTDALGQLLSEYTKRVYTSQLQHLKDIAGTLATEEADDPAHVSKLRSALESVDHKRRKIMQQMRTDTALLTKEEGGSPIRNPLTAAEDARLASLISLDNILKQVKEVIRQSSTGPMRKSKRKALLELLDDLLTQMPSLLDIDHPCAQKQIMEARKVVESLQEDPDDPAPQSNALGEGEVSQWNVLQFNTGTTAPFIIKCGANSSGELVIKADLRVQEPKGGEVIRVVPRPTVLADLSFEEIKGVFEQLPEAVSLLALARTADGTRARYSRLYRTLASKVTALKETVAEMERGGVFKDVR